MLRQICIVSCFLIVGCEPAPQSEQKLESTVEAPRVLLVMKSLVNPFYLEMEKGARLAAKERGAELVVRSGTNETLVEQQADIIDEQLTNSRIDALVVAPADSVRIVPALVRAHQQGVKLVNVDNRIDPAAIRAANLPTIPFVSVDNERAAYLAARELASGVAAGTKALLIEGPRSAHNARQRRDGALKALQEAGVDVVASTEAHWRLEQAYALTKQTHQQHPDLKLVWAANDMMALGAVLYAQENQLRPWLIGGYDNIPDARMAIDEDWLQLTVDQQADEQGYHAVQAALNLLQGQEVSDTVLADARVIRQ
jgi:ribose transport system substrate-binding protein